MKAGIFGFGIILLSCFIAGSIIYITQSHHQSSPIIKAILPAEVQTYTNSKYNFSFSYPLKDKVIETNDGVKIIRENGTIFSIQIIASTSAFNRNRTISQHLVDLCRQGIVIAKCLPDSQTVISNLNGAVGNSYYLVRTQGIKKESVGPFIIFSLPSASLLQPRTIIFYPEDLKLTEDNRKQFVAIIHSFKLPITKPSTTKIGSSSAQ